MKVFISSSVLDADLAHHISAGLKALGFQVWDPTDLFPGDNWGLKLGEALEESDAMVVLLTPHSLRSTNVTSEVSFALGNQRYNGRVISVLAAPAEQLPYKAIPWILTHFPMIQLEETNGDENGLQKIAQALRAAEYAGKG